MNKSTEPKPRHTESWLAAVMADVGLHPRAKAAAYVLAQHADWTTGADAYPSVATIARAAGMPPRTVSRALEDLEDAGWAVRTGITRPRNATDYRLTMLSSATHGTTEADSVMPPTAELEQASSATHGRTAADSVLPLSSASPATGDRQFCRGWHTTSSDLIRPEGG